MTSQTTASPIIVPDNQPPPLIGLAQLMRMSLSGADLAPLAARLMARADKDPGDANALMDLSTVLQLSFKREIAMAVQAEALQMQQLYRLPATRKPAGIRLLALVSPGDLMSNTPLECLLEDSDVDLDLLYVTSGLSFPESLPEHDVLFVAIGESSQNSALLNDIQRIKEIWPRPVLNDPRRIALLSRDSTCVMLRSTPGMIMPDTARIGRHILEQIGDGRLPVSTVLASGDFPIIVRPVDSHAGKGLAKLDDPASILNYLEAMPESEFYISRFVDYRGTDGLFRKYRIVLIDGRPFVCHMAISGHWMIHYLNAGMAESPEKRAEEAHFMENFDKDFAKRHGNAFRAIHERTGLDYLGIDCGETPDGDLLIFEVDSNMVVHAIDPVDIFPYKQPQMRKVFAAFREMLANAAKLGSS